MNIRIRNICLKPGLHFGVNPKGIYLSDLKLLYYIAWNLKDHSIILLFFFYHYLFLHTLFHFHPLTPTIPILLSICVNEFFSFFCSFLPHTNPYLLTRAVCLLSFYEFVSILLYLFIFELQFSHLERGLIILVGISIIRIEWDNIYKHFINYIKCSISRSYVYKKFFFISPPAS